MTLSHRTIGATAAVLVALLLTQGCAPGQGERLSALPSDSAASTEVRLMVLYPQPTDVAQFEDDYRAHLDLLHQAMDIPEGDRPYTVTRFLPTPDGPAPYYQLFSMPFESAEALRQARGRLGEVAADAARISSGGAPVVMIGTAR